ncbi:MAG: hypothetical protein K2X32_14455 [Phycisphaerales bacterium]|nr:hypothetical protein [Phycisphaerales bacterium]
MLNNVPDVGVAICEHLRRPEGSIMHDITDRARSEILRWEQWEPRRRLQPDEWPYEYARWSDLAAACGAWLQQISLTGSDQGLVAAVLDIDSYWNDLDDLFIAAMPAITTHLKAIAATEVQPSASCAVRLLVQGRSISLQELTALYQSARTDCLKAAALDGLLTTLPMTDAVKCAREALDAESGQATRLIAATYLEQKSSAE